MTSKSVQWPIGDWQMNNERLPLPATKSVVVVCRGSSRGYYGGEDAIFVVSRDKAEVMSVRDARRLASELLTRPDVDRTEVETGAR